MAIHQKFDSARCHEGANGGFSRPFAWCLGAIIVALLIFHACTLAAWPNPFLDEAWFIARAQGFSEHGYPFGALDVGVFDKLPGYRYFFPYFSTALQAIPFLFDKEPSLLFTRFISFFSGCIVVYCLYVVGKWVSGPITGLLSAALALSAPFFATSGHLARIDSEAAAVGFVGLTLIVTNERRTWLRFLMGGFLAGLAVEFHAHAAVITVTALVAALMLGSSMRERAGSLLVTVIGCGLSGLLYAALHIFPNPEGFVAFQRIAFAPTHTPPLLTFDPRVMAEGIFIALQTFGLPGLPFLILYFFVVVGGLALSRGRVRRIGMLATVAIVSSGLLIRYKFEYYNIYFHPLTMVFFASLACSLSREVDSWTLGMRTCGRFLQGCVIGLSLQLPLKFGVTAYLMIRDGAPKDPLPDFSAYIRSEDRILGNQTFWFSVKSSHYYSPEHLIYYTRWKAGSTVSDALRDFRPTVIIEDAHVRDFLAARQGGCWYICYPDDGLTSLLAESDLVAELQSEAYGDIRIYRTRGSL